MTRHIEERDNRMRDWSIIIFTYVAFGTYDLAKRLVALMAIVGVLVRLFPDIVSAISGIGWVWPGKVATWAGQNYLPLSVLVLLYLVWAIRREIGKIQETQGTHDLILAGLMNYVDAVPRPPAEEEQERKGNRRFVSDAMRRFWNYWGNHAWIPIWGGLVRDMHRSKIYNTTLVRNGRKVTLTMDLHTNSGKDQCADT